MEEALIFYVFKPGVDLHEIVARSHSCIVALRYFCCGNCGNLNATVLLWKVDASGTGWCPRDTEACMGCRSRFGVPPPPLAAHRSGLTCFRVLVFPVRSLMYLAMSSFRPALLENEAEKKFTIVTPFQMFWSTHNINVLVTNDHHTGYPPMNGLIYILIMFYHDVNTIYVSVL